jgi:two-component system sensor histidine kinase AtoS
MAQIDRLDAAVRDALIYSRPKPPRRRPHPIGAVLKRVLNFLGEEPAIRDIHVKCSGLDADIIADVDEAQLQQVISNLLLNAAHASPPDGVVRLELTETDQWVRITVSDDGHGMPPEVKSNAFEPFYTTKAKGTGLGLPICKHIVVAHGGTISVESRQSEGTTVLVDLPKNDGAVSADSVEAVA